MRALDGVRGHVDEITSRRLAVEAKLASFHFNRLEFSARLMDERFDGGRFLLALINLVESGEERHDFGMVSLLNAHAAGP